MFLIDEVKNIFSCPDSVMVANPCRGIIIVKMQLYRISRGRGRSTIRFDPVVKCTSCGRRFRVYKDTNPESADIVQLAPVIKRM